MSDFEERLDHVNEWVFNMVIEKNKTYGDSVGKATALLKILYSPHICFYQYSTLHYVIRILDKLSRIAGGEVDEKKTRDAWTDIAGYALLAASELEDE